MSIYEFGETTYYEATVHGQLHNGPPITIVDPPYWWPLRDRVYAAARAVIPFPRADFHLLYRHATGGQISRMRWILDTEIEGPTLLWHEDTSGTSIIAFRILKQMHVQECREDPQEPMPWYELYDALPAALAKQALGTEPIDIPLDDHDTMVFTPHEITYTRNGHTTVQEPYSDPICGWTFPVDQPVPHEPTLWIVPAGQSTGMKLSMCVDSKGTRWSDPTEPAPPFEPLPPPTGSAP